ncbi:potassium/proton antiporter regulatory subunit, CPA2 family [Micromonospora viridifaciens]|uniref:Potassium/proton antiporter regulatory subunit, CPA2 family n=1 Tax=Micromonospora viridifaciens TaxID=1881 RepID=A0A1C4XD89_MICVI|nr:TrkA C-terminal domain-containing protein [Micromonospora viridifaciens]SCF06458.1 potassium/proton antiporter regulatory subunit, CPA2 family [Micromonospora viridifaciens]
MRVERTGLPGIGVRYAATTAGRQRLGVIHHLTGRRDLVFYDPEDPQAVAATVVLRPDEAHQVADLLDATVTIDHLTDLEQQIAGISAARIRIPAGSAYANRPIRDIRPHAGALIVAVRHDQQIVTAPGPDLVLHPGDTVVAVGDQEAIDALADILTPSTTTRPGTIS